VIEHSQHHRADLGAPGRSLRVVEQGQASSQEEDAHQWECDQCQSATAFRIDEEQGGDGENDLNRAIAQGRIQCLGCSISDVLEDGRGVERDD
jgi:hypothetical protein